MKGYTHKALFVSALTLAATLGVATSSLAMSATSVGDLDSDYTNGKLVKHHNRLFALVQAADNQLNVAVSNRAGENWEMLPGSTDTIGRLPSEDVESIGPIRVFRNRVFVSLTVDGQAELYSMVIHDRPARWKQSGETGLAVDGTAVSALLTTRDDNGVGVRGHRDALYAFVNTASGSQLVKSTNASDWETIGSAGLGNDVTSVSAAAVLLVDDARYAYVGSDDGSIYRSSVEDMATWELVLDLGDEITALRTIQGTLYAGVVTDGVIDIQYSDDGTEYQSSDTSDLSEGAVAVTGFQNWNRNGEVRALISNETNGAELASLDESTQTWEVEITDGVDNTNNTSFASLIPYRANRYMIANNATDGVSIFRINK